MTVRVVVAGAGWVATHRHIPAMHRSRGFRIVGIVDRGEERARSVAERLGVPWFAGDTPSSAPFFAEADAVVCAAAPFVHAPVASDALSHGKHVLTEKPFTLTVEEGEAIVSLAAEHRRQIAVVHNLQFSRSFRTMERWIAAGRLGRVTAVHGVQFSNPRRSLPGWIDDLPLGLFYDESPHLLYLVRRLVSAEMEPLAVVAHRATNPGTATPAVVEAHYSAGGIPVIIQMNFEAAVSEWHIAVSAERGTAICDLFRDIPIFLPNDGEHTATTVLRTSLRGSLGHWAGYLRNGVPHL
ncbi:MAG: Gfo/Idh/MocA family oxidoreductase, partial [Acidimicrobiia bacterium]|nr:Gfo/Idh/MocA family oxidoreductase [Acidimicrobiia bacterium]